MEENDNKNNINEICINNIIYKTWSVELIRPFITNFLKEKYPKSLILSEINKIDILLLDNESNEIIPVEIQKTPIDYRNGSCFRHAGFEDMIRRQLEDNIENYEKCWFFFDSEYLRFLQSKDVGKNTSINMTWLVKLMKENKLKVFVMRYDGIVTELTTKDFDFLKNISQTCIIGYENDDRILNRNKLKILKNVLHGYNFTQKEIHKFENDFKNSNEEKRNIYFIKSGDKRCNLYGYILQTITTLKRVNEILDMNNSDPADRRYATCIGVFEIIGNHASGQRGHHMKFVDKFDICKYFPGYLRREKHWLTYKGNELDGKTVSNMCGGMYRNSSTLFDF